VRRPDKVDIRRHRVQIETLARLPTPFSAEAVLRTHALFRGAILSHPSCGHNSRSEG
jgi:hypothetical protein